jgi:cytidine deaminase
MSDAVDWDPLRRAAQRARENAYAPYSSICVGAAVLAGGEVFGGCNVENASYPVGLCAERAALAAAVAAGHRRIDAVVIAAERQMSPCGMCRQALAEFNPEVPILIVGDDGERAATLDELLPQPFLLEGV